MDTFLSPDIFDFFGPPRALWIDKNAKNSHENADVYATRLARSASVRAGSNKNRVSGSSFLQKMPKSTVKCHRPRAAQKSHFVIKFEYKMDTFLSLDIFRIFSPPGALLVVKNAKNSHENADVYATRLAQSSSVRAGSNKNRVSGSSFLQKMPKWTLF